MITQGVGRTDIGTKRDCNEDAFFVDNEQGLYVVCDGLGGHAAGELAAKTALEALREHIAEGREVLEGRRSRALSLEAAVELLEQAVQRANRRVRELSQREPRYRGMGCSLTAVLAFAEQAIMAHVGHTRLYLARDDKFAQLSTDHTLLADLIRAGARELAQKRRSSHATSLTRVVGLQDAVSVDTLVVDLLPDDRLLLCSDGLLRGLEHPISLAPTLRGDFEEVADALVHEANERGGEDNSTAVVIRVLADKSAPAPSATAEEIAHQLDLLSTVPLFSVLSFAQRQRIRNLGRVVRLGLEDTLLAEGDVGERMYLVLQGKLEIWRDEEHLDVLREGDTIGELNLVCRRPSEVTYIAAKPSTLMAIDRRAFRKLTHQRPWMGVRLLEELFRLACKRGIAW